MLVEQFRVKSNQSRPASTSRSLNDRVTCAKTPTPLALGLNVEESLRREQFSCEAFDDVGCSAAGEDFPSVGFDFEVRGVVEFGDCAEGLLQLAARGAERAEVFGINGDAEVDSSHRGCRGTRGKLLR